MALSLATIIMTLVDFPSLPSRIPHHFTADGTPDSYGGKTVIWIVPTLSLLLTVLLTWLNRYPQRFNYPVTITPANAARQYRYATTLVRWVKLLLSGMFLHITWITLRIASGAEQSIPIVVFVLFLTSLFGAIGYYLFAALKHA